MTDLRATENRACAAIVTVIAVLGLGLLAACTSATVRHSTQNSGIRGTTMVDGGCPLMRDSSPCPDRPIAARLVITTNPAQRTVARVATDAAGHFHVPLAPGTYTIHPHNRTGAVVPAAGIVTVVVSPGQFTDLTIHFDSGIR